MASAWGAVLGFVVCWSGWGIYAGAMYHLAAPRGSCLLPAIENRTLDLVCEQQDSNHAGLGGPCGVQSMSWVKVGHDTLTNITDTAKFGVWRALPGWGMDSGEHVALLRIRDFGVQDVGRYQCQIKCKDTAGMIKSIYRDVDVCMQHQSPKYAVCGSYMMDQQCAHAFWNGICDGRCDDADGLYDGYDCLDQAPTCHPTHDDFCRDRYGNGECDMVCDNPGCAWDGGDCISESLPLAQDTLVISLPSWWRLAPKAIDLRKLGRKLSTLIRGTIFRVLPDGPILEGRQRKREKIMTSFASEQSSLGYKRDFGHSFESKIFFMLDNTKCTERCFQAAEEASRFIMLAVRNGWDLGIPIASVGVFREVKSQCPLENNTMLHIDLSSLSNDPDGLYSYRGSSSRESGGMGGSSSVPELWVLIAGILGGICLMMLVFATVFVVCRWKHMRKRQRHRDEVERITAELKDTPAATDV